MGQGHTGDVARPTFRARRRRQVVLLLLGLPFLAVLGGVKVFLGRVNGAVIGSIIALLTLGYVTFAVIFSLRNWRCPYCNRWLGNQLNPQSCEGCGVRFGP
jgi:hypothetical protein